MDKPTTKTDHPSIIPPTNHLKPISHPEPPVLAFRDLGFSATPSTLSALFARAHPHPPKRIINGVSGAARRGQLLFIMGPSGAGKTSALDAIAGLVAAPVDGHVFLHGRPADHRARKLSLKYVPQVPALFETLTVEETLRYAAEFYCQHPPDRPQRVEDAIAALGLESARHIKCGGVFYRGLSAGQRRRLAIGIELVARPPVLLLDEPSTGLDSASAFQVVHHLRTVARSGVAVVATIHQPTQRIMALSDHLILLSAGRVAYNGPTDAAVAYFTSRGCVLPDRTSLAEWLLDEISTDFAPHPERVQQLIDSWQSSPERHLINDRVDDASKSALETDRKELVYKRSVLAQTALLAKRNLTEAFRNPAVIYLRLVMYLGLALLIGLAWWRMELRAGRVRDRLSALFYTSAFMIFMSIAVLPVYLNEKQIVIRERTNASYSSVAYLSGHFIMEVAFMAVMSVVLSGVLYYMAGFNPQFSRFAFFALTLFASLLVAESIMILIAATVPFLLVGIAAGALLFGIFMVVQGFFRPLNRISWVLRWMQYISLHTFSFTAFTINELQGVTYLADPDNFPPFPAEVTGDELLVALGFPTDSKWVCIAAMFAMIVVYRLLALTWVAMRWNGKK